MRGKPYRLFPAKTSEKASGADGVGNHAGAVGHEKHSHHTALVCAPAIDIHPGRPPVGGMETEKFTQTIYKF